jgi:uncharacterized membrane protein YsdA (DUF1294 family)
VWYTIGFGIPAVLLSLGIYAGLDRVIEWPHYYFTWVISSSVVAFLFYGLDKGLAKARPSRIRVPELVLNLLAVAGGSPGVWLGRVAFRHKTNLRRHWIMLVILIASSLLHVYVLHMLYSASMQ